MNLTCIVLAGGLGTRLRSAVPDLPKCLAPIAGRPFLEWQLRSLAERGVGRFVLALGHGADQVMDALQQPWTDSLEITCVVERELLGTGGATRFAMTEANVQDALVVNGDTWLGGSLDAILAPWNDGEFMRMATVEVPERARFGGVSVGADHRVQAFLEKGQTGAGQINAGLYRLRLSVFDGEPDGALSMESAVMPRLVARGALTAYQVAGPFIDIGIPDDYRFFDQNVGDYVNRR